MNLTDEEEAKIVKCCEAIKKIIKPHAKELAKLLGIQHQNATMRLLKPYFRAEDGRSKRWTVKAYIWVCPVDGDVDLWAQSDPVIVRGMVGIAQLIRDYIGTYHDALPDGVSGSEQMAGKKPFLMKRLMHHLERMRPAFSRGKGSASTRWYYHASGYDYMLQADISRIDEEST